MNKARISEALGEILDARRMTPAEVDSRYETAGDRGYWESLNPGFSIGGKGSIEIAETAPPGDGELSDLTRKLAATGWFQTQPLLSDQITGALRGCIEKLRSEDWPAIFAYVYDQFWQVSRLPSVVKLISAHLGPGYFQIPHAWMFYVEARPGARGWPPHADAADRAGRLTVWIPLTDATVENGCIYVIPKDRVPEGFGEGFFRGEPVSYPDLRTVLQASRALPARRGSFLGWDHQLIHWSSICGNPAEPRISISVEFIGLHEEPVPDELPLLEAGSGLPTFAERLMVIARALKTYQHFEPLMIRYIDLANRMTS